MKKIVKLSFLILFLSFLISVDIQAQVVTEILNRMDNHRKSLDSLKAEIEMQKRDDLLDETDRTYGTIIFYTESGKNFIRINWTKPIEEYLSVAYGRYKIYRPRLKQALCGNTKDAKNSEKVGNALDFLSMSKAELKANYRVRYIDKNIVNKVSIPHIELIPKRASAYKSADLWIDDDGMPVQAKINEKNNDSTTVILTKVQKNLKEIDGSIFDIKLPKNVKCIKD